MSGASQDTRRKLPKMDKVLSWPEIASLRSLTSHVGLKQAVRNVLDQLRSSLAVNPATDLTPVSISHLVRNQIRIAETPSLRRVINGSGVVVHTNLGRSPLAGSRGCAALKACYSNLEFDLCGESGGNVYAHVENLNLRTDRC